MVNAQDCARNYTVQPGDVCDKISAAQNVSTYASISFLTLFMLRKKNPDLLCQCRYQLATVNEKIIDPACDNLQVGEVSFSPAKFLSFPVLIYIYIYSSFLLGNLPRSCRQRLSISPRRTERRNLCYNRFSS